MGRQESEARQKEIIRQIRRLADDLEELEREGSEQETKESIWDLYIPRGLRNIHRLPKPML